MKIPHRFTGETIYEAEAETMSDLVDAAVENGVSLKEADLQGADLQGADLLGLADLQGADLQGADLLGTNLQGANLERVSLEGANLGYTCVIDIGQRSDGYQFYLHCGLDEPHILAGCRYFTVADARKHWRKTRGGTPLGKESLRMVSDGVARAKIRGLI